MKVFITKEFTESAANLPLKQTEYGRATKGAAMAMLCKFYLNTKQWQQASLMADQIIGLNAYKLFPDITNLFAVQNNHNSEYIYYSPCASSPLGYGNLIMAHCFPPNYPIQSNWINYATDFHILSWLVNSYDPNDKRLKLILTSYVDIRGNTIQLNRDAIGNPLNLSAPFKYTPDPNSSAEHHGNYIPIIRYADILLSKAEALNNINGPNNVSFDLIDSVRLRSGNLPINRSAYTTTDELNTQLLQERAWEFVGEGLRRMDMIRMGKFISSAQGRGLNAQSYMTLYPIPQSEIQNNPNLKQNPGYPK
mgnify:CR=1 FL=1